MIDEKRLIKTLLSWKESGNEYTGLKEGALLDKVIDEVVNQSIKYRITASDITNSAKSKMCEKYCKVADKCQKLDNETRRILCPLRDI